MVLVRCLQRSLISTRSSRSISLQSLSSSRLSYFSQIRFSSSSSPSTEQTPIGPPLKVAIIGSGPSAIYLSVKLLSSNKIEYEVDMFEKKPFPYGLIRFGVAPDHPEFNECNGRAEHAVKYGPKFKFFGNVEIGNHISIDELMKNYNIVVFAYGSSKARKLGIPGEESPAVIDSRSFVGWYNGDPEYKNLNPPLEKVSDVTIIGNGNVAMDIVRILLAPPNEHWSKTDISDYALEKLKTSKVKHVTVTARRGFFESAFSNKEFKECIEMCKKGVFFTGLSDSESYLDPLLREASNVMRRTEKRRLQLVDNCKKNEYLSQISNFANPKTWNLDFLKTPKEFKADPNDQSLLKSTVFVKNVLSMPEPESPPSIVPTDEIYELPNQLVITSVGYKCEPIKGMKDAGIPFDEDRGMIPNTRGKIKVKSQLYNTLAYATGWLATGGKGAISSSVISSQTLVDDIRELVESYKQLREEKQGRSAIEPLIDEREVDVVTWGDYKALESHEKELAVSYNKEGYKLTDYDEMMNIIHKNRQIHEK